MDEKRKRSKPLTKKDINIIKELLINGKNLNFIAKSYGRSLNSLRVSLFNKGIKVRDFQKGNSKTPSSFQKSLKNGLSISQRIMELTGLTVKDSQVPVYFNDEQLLEWREGIEGFVKFSFDVLGVELQEYQVKIAHMFYNNRHSVALNGRRSGKTFLSALYVLWRSIITPNEKILLISPSAESSLIIFKQILEFIARSQELRWDIAIDRADEIEFRNKSNIKSLSSQSLALRGRENSIVVIDEATGVENPQNVMASVSPSLASRKGSQLIMISTPGARQGLMWDAYNSPLYAKVKYPSTINKYLDLEWLELEKQKLPVEIYQMEYECEWCDAQTMFFQTKVINKCKEKYDFINFKEEGKEYLIGIDIGRLHDYSVVTILSKKITSTNPIEYELKIENIITLVNIPFQAQISRFKNLFKEYKPSAIRIEYAGLSMPVVEQLELECNNFNIVRFVPTIKSKEEGYLNLLKEMENGNLTIPDYEPLINEMRNFIFVYTPRGVKLHHASNSSDDIIDSLMFSVSAIKFNVAYDFCIV